VNTEPAYRLIEHTADMGIEARAASPEAVLVAMACGLKELMFGDSPVRERLQTQVSCSGADAVEQLVAWLNEVVYWCDQDNRVPARFAVTLHEDRQLKGTIWGEPFDSRRHAMERQVKSVTYHQACLTCGGDGCFARVYVDL
jgi:SHS2 domain-containing protein